MKKQFVLFIFIVLFMILLFTVAFAEPILKVSTDASTYDYSDVVVVTAKITNPDGTDEGLAEKYPDAHFRLTLLNSQGEVVQGFIVQGHSGLSTENDFPLSRDEMPAGYYKVLVTTNVEDLATETDLFYYTADKTNLIDPVECQLEATINLKKVGWNDDLLLEAFVTDKDGNPAKGVKVGFQILYPSRNVSNYYGSSSWLFNTTKKDGKCSVNSRKNQKSGVIDGQYIARVFIAGTSTAVEFQFEFFNREGPIIDSTEKNGLTFDNDGIWRYYENDSFVEKTGIVEFEGGQFFVANGLLCSDANGLNEYDGQWYFLANGQIQTQYTGLALYDDHWFYLKNGLLDTNLSGLVDYDGSKFIVAAGQLIRGVNGLWQNTDGTWYFLADSQVVTYFRGMAEYDGNWFYIIDGRLAVEYTGNVVDGDREFYVVNGQAVQ